MARRYGSGHNNIVSSRPAAVVEKRRNFNQTDKIAERAAGDKRPQVAPRKAFVAILGRVSGCNAVDVIVDHLARIWTGLSGGQRGGRLGLEFVGLQAGALPVSRSARSCAPSLAASATMPRSTSRRVASRASHSAKLSNGCPLHGVLLDGMYVRAWHRRATFHEQPSVPLSCGVDQHRRGCAAHAEQPGACAARVDKQRKLVRQLVLQRCAFADHGQGGIDGPSLLQVGQQRPAMRARRS